MTSNLNNKALKNIKLKVKTIDIKGSEVESNQSTVKVFDFELKSFINNVKSKKLSVNQLFEFLIKFENSVPSNYFYQSIINLGEVLLKHSYPVLAKNQCFQRYLMKQHNLDIVNCDVDLKRYIKLEAEDDCNLIVSAIFGYGFAEFCCLETIDPRFQSRSHQRTVKKLFGIFQQTMEIIAPYERNCWLLHNGSVMTYFMCRTLIATANPTMAIQPLIWAGCCLETSIPLLNITHLQWRANIYSAVCEALFNVELNTEAEAFARRGLLKISELNEVYEMSSDCRTAETALIVCEATIKMGVMIFKQNVFETRRRPKTYLRPKTKVNFKEILTGSWPRTGTERILEEMFDSPSQQMLAILEAVRQPNRVLGKIQPAAPESEWEIQDVYSELFYAAMFLITGKPTFTPTSSPKRKLQKGTSGQLRICDADPNVTQLTLAIHGGTEITIDACFELICWAFSYGNWEFVDFIIDPFLLIVKESINVLHKKVIENTLILFTLIHKMLHSSVGTDKKLVKLPNEPPPIIEENDVMPTDSGNNRRPVSSISKEKKGLRSIIDNEMNAADDTKMKNASKPQSDDHLCQLAYFVDSLLDNEFNILQYSQEILMEVGCILWRKCRPFFQSFENFSHKSISKKAIPGKWIRILYTAHRVLSVTDFALISPIEYSDLSFRLSSVLEEMSIYEDFFVEAESGNEGGNCSLINFISSLNCNQNSIRGTCITAAKRILKNTIDQMNKARIFVSMDKGNSDKWTNEDILANSTSDDLFLEINSVFLRLCARDLFLHMCVLDSQQVNMSDVKGSVFYRDAIKFCNKNLVLVAIYQAHLINLLKDNLDSSEIADSAQNIRSLIDKWMQNLSDCRSIPLSLGDDAEEERLPSPIVSRKGSNFIEVRLNMNHISEKFKSQIKSIRIYARAVDSPNAEVRFTDTKLPGTNTETFNMSSNFVLHQLIPNEQYIIAFAAFDKYGYPIGRGMGLSTKKILTTNSINKLSSICLIAQILFQIGLKSHVIELESALWIDLVDVDPCCQNITDRYQNSEQLPPSKRHRDYKFKSHLLETCSVMFLRQYCLVVLSSVDFQSQRLYKKLNNDDHILTNTATSQIPIQIYRLRLVDKLLTLFDITKKLKDNLLTMEIFVNLSHLMIPIINQNQFYEPFAEILFFGVNALHSLPHTAWVKMSSSVSTFTVLKANIHHLVACIGYYLLKCLNLKKSENELLQNIGQTITDLLQLSSSNPSILAQQETSNESATNSLIEDAKDVKVVNVQRKSTAKLNKIDNRQMNISVHQSAFENCRISMSRQTLPDSQLSGNEDADVFISYIQKVPSKISYKEASKFSRKPQYLYIMVEIIEKALVEGNFEQCLNYYKEMKEWLRKRNESIFGRSLANRQGANNNQPKEKRQEDDLEDGRKMMKQKRKAKYKVLNIRQDMTENQKLQQEKAELKALDILSIKFYSLHKRTMMKRRFRQLCVDERPSLIKMNCSMAMTYLGIANGKMDNFSQILNSGYQFCQVPELEDVTKYMLDGTGKILPLENIKVVNDKLSPTFKITKNQSSSQSDGGWTYRSDISNNSKRIISEGPKIINQFCEAISKTTALLNRAIVLASVERHWVLLCKACSLVWFSFSHLVNTFCRLMKLINLAKLEFPEIDLNQFLGNDLKHIYKMFSAPFYHGSESLLDLTELLLSNSSNNHIKSNFDMEFFENFILRSIHVLYESNKFERVIHVILRFSKLFNFTFVNATHPILIQSQEKLRQKAAKYNHHLQHKDFHGELCQQYIKQCLQKLNLTVLNSSNYDDFCRKIRSGQTGKLSVLLRETKLKAFPPSLPSELKDDSPQMQHLFRILKSEKKMPTIFSVPIDIDASEKEWSEFGSLRIGRKMWIELCQKKNYFHFIQDPNFNHHENTSEMSFQQLFNSFKDMLKYHTEYDSLLLRNMGDICKWHLFDKNMAMTLWKQSLEVILNEKQSIKSLMTLLHLDQGDFLKSTVAMEAIQSKFGTENCLIVASLLSRMARFGDINEGERISIICQAAAFYKSAYNTSLAHPAHDFGYLDHFLSLDADCPTPLLPPKNMFSKYSLLDVQDTETNLSFLLTYLLQSGYFEFSISLVALYEYIVHTVCRNPLKSVQAKIMKLQISIQLRRFSDASRTLFQLFTGDGIPQIVHSRPAPTMSKTSPNVYHDEKLILDDNNLIVLDKIISRRINPTWAQQIGPALSNQISLLQAEFLIELSMCIPVSPDLISTKDYISPIESSTIKKPVTKKSNLFSIQTEEESCSVLNNLSSNLERSSWKEIGLRTLKGIMLQVANEITQPIIEDFLSSIQREDPSLFKMSFTDVESVLHGLLVQSKNYRIRHCNRSGARLAMFASELLQKTVLHPVDIDSKTTRIYTSLNILLHLKCNQRMVECLLDEISIANVVDSSETAIPDVPPVKDLIMSSIWECDQHGLLQSKSWFVSALGQYALLSGYEMNKYEDILQESLVDLKNEIYLSYEAEMVLIDTRIRAMNVQISKINTCVLETTIADLENQFQELHKQILKKIDNSHPKSVFWNTNDYDLSIVDTKNCYDRTFSYACKMKLLLGLITMEKTQFIKHTLPLKNKALLILNMGLSMLRCLSRREPWVECEFLLTIGRIQRNMISSGQTSGLSAVGTLMKGLQLSCQSSAHLGMKKQFLLELSLTFMRCSNLCEDAFDDQGFIFNSANLSSKSSFDQKVISKTEASNYKRLSCLAVENANAISNCILKLNALKNNSNMTVSQEAQDNLPLCILYDLHGRYLLGNQRIVFKNEIEEELYSMPEARIPRDGEHLDEQILKIKNSIKTVNLSHILQYQELLLKLTSNLVVEATSSQGSGLMLNLLTRSMLANESLFEKEDQIHTFLTRSCSEYEQWCSITIPEEFHKFSFFNPSDGIKDVFFQTLNNHQQQNVIANTMTINDLKDVTEQVQYQLPCSVFDYPEGILNSLEYLKVDASNDFDLLFQPYDPPFECKLRCSGRMLLIYSYKSKETKTDNVVMGWILIPTGKFLQVHQDLQEIIQMMSNGIISQEKITLLNRKSSDSRSSTSPCSSTKAVSPTGVSMQSKSLKTTKKTAQQIILIPAGSELSIVELKIRQTLDLIASWTSTDRSFSFSPAPDVLITRSSDESSFIISNSETMVNVIPFDWTEDNIRSLCHGLHPYLPRPFKDKIMMKLIQDLFLFK